MHTRSVLITGGTGFLGIYCARLFLKKGYQVILYDIAPLDAADLIGKVTYIQADVLDHKTLLRSLKKVAWVIHAAAALPIAHDRQIIWNTNVFGTQSVLDAAKKAGVKRVVFISSTAVYGVPIELPETETAPIRPIGHYGESKVAAEELCRQAMSDGLEVTIIRPKTFLGPERLGVFQLWFEAIATGMPVFLLGSGNNPYQLLAVEDVAQACFLALTSSHTNDVFNIGTETFGTWREDLGTLIRHAGTSSRIIGLPLLPSQIILAVLDRLRLSPIAAWHYKTIAAPSYVSTNKIKALLGWKATQSNSALLIKSYDWYKKHRSNLMGKKGTTHRVGWNFGILSLFQKLFPVK
jgi:nucleoside-diphosphate-sugar epimerase